MKKLFVLGSGFTRSFSQNAPTLDSILTDITDSDINRLIGGFRGLGILSSEEVASLLLDSLYDLNPEELIERSRVTFQFIKEIQSKFYGLKATNEDSTRKIIIDQFKSTDDNKVYVATFNYDMLIEDYSPYYEYIVPLGPNPYEEKKAGFTFGTAQHPVWLLKLHGSINWFGNSGTSIDLANTCAFRPNEKSSEYILKNTSPTIIPFVFNKSDFIRGDLFTIMWRKMDMLLQEVDEIEFVGYGFPKSDNQFLPRFMKYIDKIKSVVVLDDSDHRLENIFGNRLVLKDAETFFLTSRST